MEMLVVVLLELLVDVLHGIYTRVLIRFCDIILRIIICTPYVILARKYYISVDTILRYNITQYNTHSVCDIGQKILYCCASI